MKTLSYLPRRETTINRNKLLGEDLFIFFCYSQDTGPEAYFQVELVFDVCEDMANKVVKWPNKSKELERPTEARL